MQRVSPDSLPWHPPRVEPEACIAASRDGGCRGFVPLALEPVDIGRDPLLGTEDRLPAKVTFGARYIERLAPIPHLVDSPIHRDRRAVARAVGQNRNVLI